MDKVLLAYMAFIILFALLFYKDEGRMMHAFRIRMVRNRNLRRLHILIVTQAVMGFNVLLAAISPEVYSGCVFFGIMSMVYGLAMMWRERLVFALRSKLPFFLSAIIMLAVIPDAESFASALSLALMTVGLMFYPSQRSCRGVLIPGKSDPVDWYHD
jgi:hypothetical protein